MQNLKLKNFKAHQNLDEIKLDNKNFLLYGDNGAGKSSIYEALKIVFYKDRLESVVKKQTTEENQEEKIKEFYREFNNKMAVRGYFGFAGSGGGNFGNSNFASSDFEIKINDEDFKSFDITPYRVYMLNLDDVVFGSTLKLSILLEKVFFNLPKSICYGYQDIEQRANTFLESCLEDIRIEIDVSDDYSIKLENTQRNITKTKELTKYFNEARLNLVIFALLFSAIEVSKDDTKKNVLILDDFITSLDMANRTFLMKHILETFKDFQIVVFTHNVYFYNLIMYLVNDKICTTDKEWQFANLYEIGNEHKFYIYDSKDTVSELSKKYKPSDTTFDIAKYGNELRKKFEELLYELSKIIMIGGVEESNKILEAILNGKIYLDYTRSKDCYDLINEIEVKVTEDDGQGYLASKITSKISSYRSSAFEELQEVLKTLKLYRKVSMHSLSHGQTGQHNWSDKEVKQTLLLLKKLETNIQSLTNSTVN